MSDLFFGNFVFGMDEIVPYEEYNGPTDLLNEVIMLITPFIEKNEYNSIAMLSYKDRKAITIRCRAFKSFYPMGRMIDFFFTAPVGFNVKNDDVADGLYRGIQTLAHMRKIDLSSEEDFMKMTMIRDFIAQHSM